MPPKGNNNNTKKGGGGAKSKKAREDEEFEALLKQGTKENKAKFEEKAKEQKKKEANAPKMDRATKHAQFYAAKDKAAEAQMQRALEQQQQQQKLQQLIQQMQSGGGMGGGFGGFGSPFLTEPKTDITSEAKENKLFDVATVEMQGWRKEMEDAHFNALDFSEKEGAGLFGVFDGHSGKKVAQIAKLGLPALAKKYYKGGDQLENPEFFKQVYEDLDVSLRGKDEASGATAVCALISKDFISGISVGDSRAVVGRSTGEAIPLSFDHKPENDEEKARIEAAGGHVANNRTNGELAMSRAIGDFRYKNVDGKAPNEQLVIAVPEIHTVARTPEDQFVVVACDGIFDVLSNDEVIKFVIENRPSCKTLTELGEKLLKRCLAPARGPGEPPARPDGTDNMTCTIIELKK